MKPSRWPEATQAPFIYLADSIPSPPKQCLRRLPKNPAIYQLAQHWINDLALEGRAQGGLNRYGGAVQQFVARYGKRQITTDGIAQYFHGKRIGPDYCAIQSFFKWCGAHGYENPGADLKLRLSPIGTRRETFTHNEYKRIIQESAGTFWRYASIVAYHTGMRKSDVASLRWSSIDLLRNTITIAPLKTLKFDTRTTVTIVPGTDLANMLMELHPNADLSGYVCPEMVSESSTDFRKILKQCGIVGKCFHTFRRTFITNMLESGADSYIVMKIVGIRSHDTMKHYVAPRQAVLNAVMVKALAMTYAN